MPVFPPYFSGLMEARVEQIMPSGAEAVSVFYGVDDTDTTPDITRLELFAATIVEGFYEPIALASLSTQWQIQQVHAIARGGAAGQEAFYTTALAGSETADPLPSQTQLCVTWRTGITGRRYRGRTFVGGFTEDSNDTDGTPLPATIDVVQDAADALLAGLVAVDMQLVVLSRGATSPPAPAAWTAFNTPVAQATVNDEWDVLRSRRR